jgi:hypothetical protein
MGLVAHVVLYITFASAVMDTLNTLSRRVPEWDAFWGAISPYSVLYTSGKCIIRLTQCGVPGLLIAGAYLIMRMGRKAPQAPRSAPSCVWANIDYVANRLIVRSTHDYYAGLGTTNVYIALCAFCTYVVLSGAGRRLQSNPTVASFMGVTALEFAQQATRAVANPEITLAISLAAVAALAVFRVDLNWVGKVACMGVSLSVSAQLPRARGMNVSTWQEMAMAYGFIFGVLYTLRSSQEEGGGHKTELAHADAPLGVVAALGRGVTPTA